MLSTETLLTVADQGVGSLEEAAAEILSLRQLLIALRQGSCWCRVSQGDPQMGGHSMGCVMVTDYLKQRPFIPEENP